MHGTTLLEGIAAEIHDKTGALVPVDAFELAELCGLEVRGWMRACGSIGGGVIRVPLRARETRQHGIIAHELGHWALARAKEPDCEASARYLAGALMLPRGLFWRQVEAVNLDVPALLELHPNASWEMVVARITQVRPATAWVWDEGKLKRQYGTEEAPAYLLDEVLSTGHAATDGSLRAWPVFDGSFRRVVGVAG